MQFFLFSSWVLFCCYFHFISLFLMYFLNKNTFSWKFQNWLLHFIHKHTAHKINSGFIIFLIILWAQGRFFNRKLAHPLFHYTKGKEKKMNWMGLLLLSHCQHWIDDRKIKSWQQTLSTIFQILFFICCPF